MNAPCRWTQDDDGAAVWTASCQGNLCFEFNDGGPTENNMKFCCYCGHPLLPVPYVPPPEEEDDERPSR